MSAEKIYQQLIRLGRERRRPGDEMITLYGLERVLSRLAQTRFVNDFPSRVAYSWQLSA